MKHLFLLMTVCAGIQMYAYDFEVNGIYYNFNSDDSTTVSVTARDHIVTSAYHGDIIIPELVTYCGKDYNVTAIDEIAFYESWLNSIVIPNSITTIGRKAFYSCLDLESVSIGKSVNNIGEFAFSCCSSIKSLTWNAVNCMSNGGMSTSKIERVIIGDDVETLPSHFVSSSKITELKIPQSIVAIGESAFSSCMNIKKLVWNAINCPTKGNMPVFNLEDLIIGESVEVLPSGLAYNSKISEVIIPNSVTTIGSSAFGNCTALTNVMISNSVISIGPSAFSGCSELLNINIPNRITILNNAVFKNCMKLSSITIPDSVTSIGESVFEYCSGLKSVNIPNSVTYIGDNAFRGCIGITNANISNSVTSIGSSVFSGCISLASVSIPNTVTSIGISAFSYCTGLTSVTIPCSVTYIGANAFRGCTGLTSITIPCSVTSIGPSAFADCNSLETLNFNAVSCADFSSGSNLEYHQFYGSNISSINFGDSVIIIPAYFTQAGFTGLTSVTIPNSVTSIGNYAFYGCILSGTLTIPSSVTVIGSYAFYNSRLTHVVILKSTPPSGANNMFSRNPVIYVPNVLNYKNSSYWSAYNIQEFYSINPNLTMATVTSNYELLLLKKAVLKDNNGYPQMTFYAQDNSLIITDLMPNTTTNAILTIIYNQDEYEFEDKIISKSLVFSPIFSSTTTQTTLTPTFSVGRDEGLVIDACGVESYSESYSGHIKETTNDSYTIECILSGLTPSRNYSLRPWIQYKGIKFYGNFNTISTSAVELDNIVSVTPTSVYLSGNHLSPGDAIVTNSYFSFYGEIMENLYQTGLDPNTTYCYSHTIETTTGNQETGYGFRTLALSMVAQPVKMLTNTKVLFEAQTNMIDEETMVGFEWRRYDAPNEMPSTKVYSPVFGGKIAGTLKNLSENVYYKYRPFYTSNSGKSYYGNWVAFLTADAGVEYEPMVYTYNSPKVTQTDATLEGVALQGSDEITEQGFEYWKSGNSNVIKVTATGERMSKKVSGLQSGAKYAFRAFLTAGGETRYGNEVEFVTLSNSLDVNLDGEINIADINAVIDKILTGASSISGDVNGDGEVNIADINCIIDAILSH